MKLSLALFSLFLISNSYAAQDYATGFVQTKEGEDFERRAPRESFNGIRAPIPTRASLRGKTGPIENQGSCGSCWDFSLTSTLRGTMMTSGRDPGRLSFNYLLNCAANAWGCNGGNFAAAEYLVNPRGAPRYGIDGEYIAKKTRCENKPVSGSAVRYRMLGKNGAKPSFQDIAYVVGVLKRPVSVSVKATSAWKAYTSGVKTSCTPSGTMNHMVVIEGYDCEGSCAFGSDGNLQAGKGTFLVRNSWGDAWGDKGWITIKATDSSGRKCDGLANQALYFDVD